jgi:hypothetical protein
VQNGAEHSLSNVGVELSADSSSSYCYSSDSALIVSDDSIERPALLKALCTTVLVVQT